MAGRGRGRGRGSLSIGIESGFGKGEAFPPPVLQPPPKYPILEYKPLDLAVTNEMGYLVELKRDFAEYMHESPNYVLPIADRKDIDRYSDRYQDFVTDKVKYESRYDWNKMPTELKPVTRKRKGAPSSNEKAKKRKEIDVEKKLLELEKKESSQQSDVEEEKEEEEAEEKDVDEQVEEEEVEQDEEMDDGTDYANSYFDNGEDYEEDDDNLDDGPIY